MQGRRRLFLPALSGKGAGRRSRPPGRRFETAARGSPGEYWPLPRGVQRLPHHPWAEAPALGWLHDPLRTGCFPQYDVADRAAGDCRYRDDDYRTLAELTERRLNQIHVFDMEEALNTEAGQRAVLDFAGFPAASQVPAVGARVVREKPKPVRPEARPTTEHPLDPGKCVILVPISGFIHPGCERLAGVRTARPPRAARRRLHLWLGGFRPGARAPPARSRYTWGRNRPPIPNPAPHRYNG